MKNKLYGALIYHQKVMAEKYLSGSHVTIGSSKSADFCVNVPALGQSYTIYDDKDGGTVYLQPNMMVSTSCGEGCRPGQSHPACYTFKSSDWLILNLAPGFDFLLYYTSVGLPPVAGSPLMMLSQALESPIARTLVLSFLLHSIVLFIAGMTGEKVEATTYKGLESRWVEVLSQVEEHVEEEKPEELPVIEDVDDVIIDDALKDMDRPKIDDTQSPIANLNKVEKPVGIQAALGGAKLHDMASLFGTSAGLGDATDFMPETADGDAFGTGAGFGAGLSGIGIAGGGGGGGGGYGSGIGGIGGGGGGGDGSAKVKGPKKSGVKQKPKLTMDAPKQGAFCKESNIRDVVQKRANALRNCYEQQLLANPDLAGKIIVFWKIGLDGKVTDASIKSTTMSNNKVESCLTQTIRRLRFDPPDGGICVIEFPFVFAAAQ